MTQARYLFIGFIISLVALTAMPFVAHADTPAQSITMSPTSVDRTINPGDSLRGTLQIINSGSEVFDFTVYATPYNVTGEEYKQHFTALPGKPDIVNWLSFSLAKGQANPNQSVSVNYTVAVPANTPPGGYYATVFAETQPATSKSSGVVVHQRVGTIFYLQVGGNAVKKGSLAGWQAKFWQLQPLTATLRVKNDGDVHFVANSQLVVRDIFGHPKYTLNTAREILPRTIRQIDLTWAKVPPVGLFKARGTVTMLGQTHALPTRYILIATWPVRVLALVALVLVILLVVTKARRHAKPKD